MRRSSDFLSQTVFTKRSLILFFILGTLLVGGYGIWRIIGNSRLKNANLILEQQVEYDLKILSQSDSSDAITSGALVRLGKLGYPAALKAALAKSKSKSPMIRLSCANALGYFETPDSLKALSQLITDEEKRVRIQAIRGLSLRRSAARNKILQNALMTSLLSNDEEKQALYLSLGEITSDPKVKENSIQELLKLSKEGFDGNLAIQATMHLISLVPEHKDVLEMLRKTLRAGGQPIIQAVAVRHLSYYKDPWLKKNLELIRNNQSVDVRMALVQSIHVLCPERRWELLESILKEDDDPNLRRKTIEEIAQLPKMKAKELLNKLQAKGSKILKEASEMASVKKVEESLLEASFDPKGSKEETDGCLQNLNEKFEFR